MVSILLIILIFGVVLGLIPMEPRLKTAGVVVILLCLCLYLLNALGVNVPTIPLR